jgi:hypothetical protein
LNSRTFRTISTTAQVKNKTWKNVTMDKYFITHEVRVF